LPEFRDDTVLRQDVFLVRFCREIGESDVKIADVFNDEPREVGARRISVVRHLVGGIGNR
jgi:hypothetical protein